MLRTAPGLAEQVYDAVVDEICAGKLACGAVLVQERLARRFDVSRQPIQQALARLRADGLVEDAGRRGVRVVPLDLDPMRHRYAIRAALDALAARSAAQRARDSDAVAVEARSCGAAILDKGRAAVEAADRAAQIRHDEAFHELLYALSGNPLLAHTAEPHWRYLRRVMGAVLEHAERAVAIWQQHAAILDAVVDGDSTLAEARATEHVNNAAQRLADALADTPVSARVAGER